MGTPPSFFSVEYEEGIKKKAGMKTIGKWKAIASTAHSGRVPMIVSAVVALFMVSSVMCGCGGSDDAAEAPSDGSSSSASAASTKKTKAPKAPPKDTLVVKGLYMGMPGDDAVEVCRKMVGDSKDLVVVDLRNGIEREKDEATKEKDRKNWEDTVKRAETDVERFLGWSSVNGKFYDPSADKCSASGIGNPYPSLDLARGSAKIDQPMVVGSAVGVLAGAYGYQVERMLPGKQKREKSEESIVPKLFTGKVKVAADPTRSDWSPDLFWKKNVFENGLIKELYANGLQLSKNNEKRAFFRLVLEDAQGKPVDKKKVAEELVLKVPEYFKDFATKQEKVEAAEKEVEGFLLWVEFLRAYGGSLKGVSIFDPEDPRTEEEKNRERRVLEAVSRMAKNGDVRGLEKMKFATKGKVAPSVAKGAEEALKAKKGGNVSPSQSTGDITEINKMKSQVRQMESRKAALEAEISGLNNSMQVLVNEVKRINSQQPFVRNGPVSQKRLAETKQKYGAAKDKRDAAIKKRNEESAAIAVIKKKIQDKEALVRRQVAENEKAAAAKKAAEEKAAAEKKAAEEKALAEKNRTDLRFLTAARTETPSGSSYEFAKAMLDIACVCNVMLEWGVLTEPADKLEEVVESVSIPAGDCKSSLKYVENLDKNLGEWSEDTVGSDGSRKRLFFEKDLIDVGSPLWLRLVLKTTNGVDVAKEDVVKNWLDLMGHHPPSNKEVIPKKNLIKIAFKQEGVREDKLKSLCNVWIDDQGNVKETFYTEQGMNRLFNSGDLSGEEFAQSLVDNYPNIPSLEPEIKREDPGRGMIQETTWTYKDPKGYQVKLFERVYFNNDGVKYTQKMLERDAEVALGLSLADKLPTRYFTVFAIKPESARKFD